MNISRFYDCGIKMGHSNISITPDTYMHLKIEDERIGDYYIPLLTLTSEEQRPIGKWGRMQREYQTIAECLLFQNSFKLGARMMAEVMGE